MSRWRKDPLQVCETKHTNATLEFHECVCKYDYRLQRRYQQALKYKHCLLADEMRRIDNFELYVIIAVVVGVVLIFGVAAFCSCKWYFHTNDNPCGCCPCRSCKKKKKRKKKEETTEAEGDATSSHGFENGNQVWTPICLVPTKEMPTDSQEPNLDTDRPVQHKRKGICMKFCLSDPVQDCCEFFDCDLMWRKKSIYTIPVFGRRKPPPMQRRPTRPAPPPPKPPVPPIVKYPEPLHIGFEELECEPIPEAPPSPEPVRVDQPRAMYVDPFAFLQKPFLKSKEKISQEEPEALYSKMKGLVFGKNKKSSSVVSLNHAGVSTNPDTVSNASSKKSKYSRTGSLASLHNLSDEQLDTSYQSKRSMSLASLHMVEEENTQQLMPKGPGSRLNVARSRGSLHNICEDDIPPSMRTDEYIDLEEMSKRIEAKMMAAQNSSPQHPTPTPQKSPVGIESKPTAPPATLGPSMRTPDFIPASAYSQHPRTDDARCSQPTGPPQHSLYAPQQNTGMRLNVGQRPVSPYGGLDSSLIVPTGDGMAPKYYPPVPATPEKPAVPARLAVGTPVSNTGTLGRAKPTVPPRPGSGSSSPKPRAPQPPSTLGRSGHVVKPTAPPPPPPVSAPIESSL